MSTTPEAASEADAILDGLRSFVATEVVKRHEHHEALLSNPRNTYLPSGRYRPDVLELMAEVRQASAAAGYYTMFVPQSLGGGGLGYDLLFRVWEDLFHRNGVHHWLAYQTVAHWSKGPSVVLEHASAPVREAVLPDLLAGRTSLCFGMSEPDAGSDARNMRTRAVRNGDSWVINGTKQWISNGPYAQHAVVFASTGETERGRATGITAFLVSTDAPGLTVDNSIRMFGQVGGEEALLYLDDVHCSDEHVLGTVGHGFPIAMSGVSAGRLYNSAKAVGYARWALEQAVTYAQRRTTFGRPISENQGVMFPLAESAIEIHGARLMGLDTARKLDTGAPCRKELAMTKAFSTEAAVRAIDRSIQTHGAMGFTNELGLTEAYQHVRKICVADGTAEVLRRTVAQALLGGDFDL